MSELIPVDVQNSQQTRRYAVVIGHIAFYPDRNYPWYGQHGCIGSFFSTQKEAEVFAETGEMP